MFETKSKIRNWSTLSIMLIAIMLLVSACGGNNQQAAQNQGNSPGNTSSLGQQNEKDEVENQKMNKPSGKVIVYSAGPAGLADNILSGFEAQTGIKVEQFQGTTGKVMS